MRGVLHTTSAEVTGFTKLCQFSVVVDLRRNEFLDVDVGIRLAPCTSWSGDELVIGPLGPGSYLFTVRAA